jgi:thymidine phosphorylase
VLAERAGIFGGWDAYPVGVAAWRLGAGRARKEDTVDPAAGVRLLVDIGEPVQAGQPLLELHTNRPDSLPGARAVLAGAARLLDEHAAAPARPTLVHATLTHASTPGCAQPPTPA